MTLIQDAGPSANAVQISGDNNTVTITCGRASLRLATPHTRKALPQTELQLLRVDLRATRLVGRSKELAELESWLASERHVSYQCVIARAGTGKTRLGLELCERAGAQKWIAGFIYAGPFGEFVKTANDWRWSQPTLVVIDYAAAMAQDVRAWLDILVDCDLETMPKLRILLLERHAETDHGWWYDLVDGFRLSGPSRGDLAYTRVPVVLSSLDTIEDRRALLNETMQLAGNLHGIADVAAPAAGVNAEFDRRLADNRHDNEPLYLMMAAVEAVHRSNKFTLSLTHAELAENAAKRECTRFERIAKSHGLPSGLLLHIVMCITLQGVFSWAAAQTLVSEECAAMSIVLPAGTQTLVEHFADAMPKTSSGEIDVLRPDLIGEAFILQVMNQHRRFEEKQYAIIDRLWRREPGGVVTTLIRIAQDFAGGSESHDSVRWLNHIVSRIGDLETLTTVALAMPSASVSLRRTAFEVHYRIVSLAQAGPETAPLFAVESLNALAYSLDSLGRRGEALQVSLEAVSIIRDLANKEPSIFQPYLALSLSNLGNALSSVGQRKAALAATWEAVTIYREVCTKRSDSFQVELAQSLNNLAKMLSDVGQKKTALDAIQESILIMRDLAHLDPDIFQPLLATSLNTLANRLTELGYSEAALDAIQEAVALQRALTVLRPDAFRPDLALLLNNLSNALKNAGRQEAALDAVREAVEIYRELAALQVDAFRPHLAGALSNFADKLQGLKQRRSAIDAISEAIAIRRDLAREEPDAFQHDLARSLGLKALLIAPDNVRAAITVEEEAIAYLAPSFFSFPLAVESLMITILAQHRQHCEEANHEPNGGLLNPIIEVLNRLEDGDSS